MITPISIKNLRPEAKSLSEINPCDHQHALFLTHDGISCVPPLPDVVACIMIIPFSIRYSIPSINEESSILSSHQNAATSLIQFGINREGALTVIRNDF